jgi:NADH-quinone oxidoreductase subunit G
MPCTAKKFEAAREEFKVNGVPNVDYVISTQELIQMIKESGIIFSDLEPEAIDMPFGTYTGAGVIFGVTGGVTEAVLRRVVSDKSATSFRSLGYTGVRGMKGVKEASVMYGDRKLRIAVVSGLKNASDLIEKIKSGEHYDLVEVMACPGGCINGGGQPFVQSEEKEKRGKGLYSADKLCNIKSSEENPLMMTLYKGALKGRVHELLHVDYAAKKEAK